MEVEACVGAIDRTSRGRRRQKSSTWRPAAGARSAGEVYMHIVLANFYLLSIKE
jgi:hypothetical protein